MFQLFGQETESNAKNQTSQRMSGETVLGAMFGVVLGLVPGFFISAWAGLVTTRVLRFEELRTEAYESLIMMQGKCITAQDRMVLTTKVEHFSRLAWRFLAQGHMCAYGCIVAMQKELLAEVNQMEIPTPAKIEFDADAQRLRFQRLDWLHFSWPAVLSPRLRPKPRPCKCA